MLLVSVARQLESGNSFARLLCCPAQAERAGKRRPPAAKLTMRPPGLAQLGLKPAIRTDELSGCSCVAGSRIRVTLTVARSNRHRLGGHKAQ